MWCDIGVAIFCLPMYTTDLAMVNCWSPTRAVLMWLTMCITTVRSFSGDITAYGASYEGGFCGFNSKSWNYNGLLTTAINQPQVDNSLACGLCAIVSYNHKSTIVLIDNVCPECKHGDLDLSQQSWQTIVGGTNYGREKASWEFVDCDQFLLPTKNIQLRPHHVNYWWLAISPSSMRCGVSAMEIKQGGDWVSMQRDNSQMNGLWFIHHTQIQLPFRFRLHSSLGDVIETEDYNEIKEVWDIGKQFECAEEQDCGTDQSSVQKPAPVPTQSCRWVCSL